MAGFFALDHFHDQQVIPRLETSERLLGNASGRNYPLTWPKYLHFLSYQDVSQSFVFRASVKYSTMYYENFIFSIDKDKIPCANGEKVTIYGGEELPLYQYSFNEQKWYKYSIKDKAWITYKTATTCDLTSLGVSLSEMKSQYIIKNDPFLRNCKLFIVTATSGVTRSTYVPSNKKSSLVAQSAPDAIFSDAEYPFLEFIANAINIYIDFPGECHLNKISIYQGKITDFYLQEKECSLILTNYTYCKEFFIPTYFTKLNIEHQLSLITLVIPLLSKLQTIRIIDCPNIKKINLSNEITQVEIEKGSLESVNACIITDRVPDISFIDNHRLEDSIHKACDFFINAKDMKLWKTKYAQNALIVDHLKLVGSYLPQTKFATEIWDDEVASFRILKAGYSLMTCPYIPGILDMTIVDEGENFLVQIKLKPTYHLSKMSEYYRMQVIFGDLNNGEEMRLGEITVGFVQHHYQPKGNLTPYIYCDGLLNLANSFSVHYGLKGEGEDLTKSGFSVSVYGTIRLYKAAYSSIKYTVQYDNGPVSEYEKEFSNFLSDLPEFVTIQFASDNIGQWTGPQDHVITVRLVAGSSYTGTYSRGPSEEYSYGEIVNLEFSPRGQYSTDELYIHWV